MCHISVLNMLVRMKFGKVYVYKEQFKGSRVLSVSKNWLIILRRIAYFYSQIGDLFLKGRAERMKDL